MNANCPSRRIAALCALMLLVVAVPAWGKPSQSDVFKSIQDNVSQTDDSISQPTPWICAGIGVVLMLALFSRRQTRAASPKPLNHQGKLLREVAAALALKQRELRQLKILVEESQSDDAPLSSPLVLLLCPSALRSASNRSTRAEHDLLIDLLQKIHES